MTGDTARAVRLATKPSLERVTHLQVEPTTRCNFTCGFCCGRHMDQSDLALEEFRRILDELPAVRHLELQGEGEPMLHKDFFRMASMARDRGISVSTITNGSMFTASRIRNILDSGIQSIMVSIESPNEKRFQEIRGGRLDKVKRGIRELIRCRDEAASGHGPALPVVGFAMTILNSTRHELPGIAALYRELGMDGGILFHPLSPMAPYSDYYDEELRGELLTPVSQALAWSRYERLIVGSPLYESPVKHFWHDLLSGRKDRAGEGSSRHFESCPWLDNALFINRHGVVTACPNVKDYERFGWGKLSSAGAVEAVLGERSRMARQLDGDAVPAACAGCFIADSICTRSKSGKLVNE